MYRRGSRGSRSRGMQAVIQSYKKVINHAPASSAAGVDRIFAATNGQDNVTVGQTSAIDFSVPTGAIVKYIEWQVGLINIVSNPAFAHVIIQLKHSGQANLSPDVIGGDPLRNNVYHQDCFSVGADQNTNRKYKFKVPKRVQRVREGDVWQVIVSVNQAYNSVCQVIYKFYR